VANVPTVVVSAARFRSLLANRHMSEEEVAAEVATSVDVRDLAREDQPVEFADLVALGKHFNRPWAYLLSDEVERFPDLGRDNRTVANQRVPASPALIAEYEAAEALLEAAADLFPEQTYEVPPTRVAGGTPVGEAGRAIRAFLGVTHEAQLGARDEFAALRLWVAALHARGVYLAQRRLRDDTVRAFSRAAGGQAVLVVDTGDTAYARIFSALHEYCHVVLRNTGICDLDEHRDVEQYCNAVAAAVLLPTDLLDAELAGVGFGASPDADDENLIRLSHRLGVSQAVLLIRLRDLRNITQATYEALEGRRSSRRASDKKPGGSYYPSAINRVGRRFARNVFGALDDGAIDRQDAGALLGVAEHTVGRFRVELFSGEAGDR
jgi:Zn-dependent peptidase ImmA (M78 family)